MSARLALIPDRAAQSALREALLDLDLSVLDELAQRWGPLDAAWQRLHPNHRVQPLLHRALSTHGLFEAFGQGPPSASQRARRRLLFDQAGRWGIGLDAYDSNADTVLHRAVQRRAPTLVEDLLAAGASPHPRTASGATALGLVPRQDVSTDALRLRLALVRAGADPGTADPPAIGPHRQPLLLHWVATAPLEHGALELLQAVAQSHHRAAWWIQGPGSADSAATVLRALLPSLPAWSAWGHRWLAELDAFALDQDLPVLDAAPPVRL